MRLIPIAAASFGKLPNPFAARAANETSQPSRVQTASQQPAPPSSSLFSPQMQKSFSGTSFRNPAFTTPQKRFDDNIFSECSMIEDSPSMTDASELPPDTPDLDRDEDFVRMTITPAIAKASLFGRTASSLRSRTPGRGEVPRGNRDKVRKRKRQVGDRDVGSVRARLPYVSDESDSDAEEARTKAAKTGPGLLASLFRTIQEHPSVPIILSWWFQMLVNVGIVSAVVWAIWGFIGMMRNDLSHATEAARAELMAEMRACAAEYAKNRCAPESERLPALDAVCNEWHACMSRDPNSVMQVQVSARNVAEVINEFVGVMSLKSWVSSLLTNHGAGQRLLIPVTVLHSRFALNGHRCQQCWIQQAPGKSSPEQPSRSSCAGGVPITGGRVAVASSDIVAGPQPSVHMGADWADTATHTKRIFHEWRRYRHRCFAVGQVPQGYYGSANP